MMEKCLERWMTSFSEKMLCVTVVINSYLNLQQTERHFHLPEGDDVGLSIFFFLNRPINIKSLQRRRLVLKYNSVGAISYSPTTRHDYHPEMSWWKIPTPQNITWCVLLQSLLISILTWCVLLQSLSDFHLDLTSQSSRCWQAAFSCHFSGVR